MPTPVVEDFQKQYVTSSRGVWSACCVGDGFLGARQVEVLKQPPLEKIVLVDDDYPYDHYPLMR
jgi:hypothetical protein